MTMRPLATVVVRLATLVLPAGVVALVVVVWVATVFGLTLV
ncbi:hypothetical protein NHF48_020900 [Sphingomonas sp. H160509]|nr:hypothetical protein [Sphingomonas sp. H160509]MDD1452825.1 hypothetical protein [Sphingomonas sp. H160509]